MPVAVLKRDLERQESRLLAPYAVKSAKSAGREFPEEDDETRTIFQRDRGRIIHSKAFRRLRGKTQVFVAAHGDHFRDRLTHTLEVAQIARDISRNLALNEDLAEAIALAHDLGHTPFGHAGEYALSEIMRKFGAHFEHNEQSKRIVEKLERSYPSFNGLNLSFEVRQGLAKHQTDYDQNHKKITGKMLEAQVVDIADEIAYHNHDIDDGLRSKLFTFKDLEKVKLWRQVGVWICGRYGDEIPHAVFKRRAIGRLVSVMIRDVLKNSCRNVEKFGIKNFNDVLNCERSAVCFSPAFGKKVSQLRNFLWRKMYQSAEVLKHSRRGQKILKDLFWHFYKHPKLLPKRFYGRIGLPPECDPLEVIVKDYVAGMTDSYAAKIWKN